MNHWWGTITQGVRADAIVMLNRLTMVLNYTFEGWMNDGDPVRANNQMNDRFMTLGVPACWSDFYLVDGWTTGVAVEELAFSY